MPDPQSTPKDPRGDAPSPFGFVLLALAAGLQFIPLIWPPKGDEFPFSPYTMFADAKDRSTTMSQAVALLPAGQERPLGPRFFNTDEVLLGRAVLAKAIKSGKRAQVELCVRLAAHVAADPELSGATAVVIRTVTVDSVDYLSGRDRTPAKSKVHAHCAVDARRAAP